MLGWVRNSLRVGRSIPTRVTVWSMYLPSLSLSRLTDHPAQSVGARVLLRRFSKESLNKRSTLNHLPDFNAQARWAPLLGGSFRGSSRHGRTLLDFWTQGIPWSYFLLFYHSHHLWLVKAGVRRYRSVSIYSMFSLPHRTWRCVPPHDCQDRLRSVCLPPISFCTDREPEFKRALDQTAYLRRRSDSYRNRHVVGWRFEDE